ncbi:TerB N-terminal domain-containing protein [Lachnospiraceae bacterium C1.1]|nr:TerB N-terminal domain-containing protein [Lachnospiraceae bacterium C1.1]
MKRRDDPKTEYYTDVKLRKSPDGKLVSEANSSGSFDFVEAKAEDKNPAEEYLTPAEKALPEKMRELKAFMNSDERMRMSKTQAFYTEAKMMEDYEDDFEGEGRIYSAFRTVYEDLDIEALRSYFSFRTAFRRGDYIRPEKENYLYILIGELLMQIGVKSPEEGLHKLYEISVNYRYNHWVYGLELDRWMKDYVVNYGLPNKYVRYVFKSEIKTDWALYVLDNCEDFSDEDLFKSVSMLSDYGMADTPFAKKYPEDALHGTATALRAMDAESRRFYKKSLAGYLHYFMRTENYRLFEGAVFYNNERPDSGSFKVDSARIFKKNFRSWKCESYGIDIGRFIWVKELNTLIREIDRQLRKAFKFGKALKKRPVSFETEEAIADGIQKYIKEKEEAKKPVIKVDLSKLSNIRSDAEYTRDSLLEGTEEDYDAEENPADSGAEEKEAIYDFHEINSDSENMTDDINVEESAENIEISADIFEGSSEIPAGLSADEAALIKCLLNGESAKDFARERHQILSVLVDSINEKLYDIFADTVIDMADDIPEIIEDYRDDLEEMFSS